MNNQKSIKICSFKCKEKNRVVWIGTKGEKLFDNKKISAEYK